MGKITISKKVFIESIENMIKEDPDTNLEGVLDAPDLMDYAIRFFLSHPGKYIKSFLIGVCKIDEKEVKKKSRPEHVDMLQKYVEFEDDIKKNGSDDDDKAKDDLLEKYYDLKKAQELYEYCKAHKKIRENSLIKIVEYFDVYVGVPITYSDCFKIKRNSKIELSKIVCMIVDREDYVVAVGILIANTNEYRIVIGNTDEDINYKKFRNLSQYRIILFENNYSELLKNWEIGNSQSIEAISVQTQIRLSDLKKTNKPLCIDFGTSNTTVGTYGLKGRDIDASSCVEFEYGKGNDIYTSKLLPTMVYTKSCENENAIEFLFGYEAKKKVVECKYDTDATVYFELKRWITELNVPEEIIEDENGNTCENVSRSIIIEDYLRYVIKMAEWYYKVKFNELHFSAPVKLKGVFIKEISKMLPDYKVYPTEKSLDEGGAIVFDYIANEIDKSIGNRDSEEHKNADSKKVLILDCGGGTTDLVNCEYDFRTDIEEGDALLKVSTQFENGNPNFGGNNITFRILQLIKIKMVDTFYSNVVESSIDTLIPFSESEILDKIDINFGKTKRPLTKEIYSKFEEMYLICEKYIPTKYVDSEYNKRESKRNYFYLWQLAEKIKVEFYKKANLTTYNLENRIGVEKIDDFYLYRLDKNDDEIVRADDIPSIEVTNNEIKKIIYADIYAVMNDLFANIDIDSFDKYMLSGQSCKVTLFQELLKEFITGRKLRETNMKTSSGTENLKLGCINGCIAFNKGIKRGEIVVDRSANNVKAAKLIYTVNLVTKDIIELVAPEKPFGGLLLDQCADELKIEVRNAQGELSRPSFVYKISQEIYKESKPIDMTKIREIVKNNSLLSDKEVDELCKILEGPGFDTLKNGMVIFATISKDGYGFNIYPLHVEKNNKNGYDYYFLNYKGNSAETFVPDYQNFESVTATFFDGHR